MVVNTESVVGYNNKLKKATTFMRIGINSDLNIPVRRSAQKHNFGRGAVKLPHSGVETQKTKETQVVKSKKKRKKRSQDCFDFAREQFECFDYYRRWLSLVSFQMKCFLAKK